MKSVFNLFVRSMPFYSVARGRATGVFATWPQCEAQVKGFTSPIFRKFSTYDEAVKFVLSNGGKLDHKIDGEKMPTGDSQNASKQTSSAGSTRSPLEKANKRLNEDVSEIKPSKIAKKDNGEIPVKRLNKYGKYSFMEDADGYVHVFTDGSCEGNGTANAVAGLGVYFGEGHELNVGKPVTGRATNNCGEIQASTLAIQLAGDCGVKKLCINTDSQFLINSVTKWIAGWKHKGWKVKSGEPVKNVIDFKALDAVMAKYSITLKWNYVKAHCGILGNERADALAKQGGEMYRSGLRSS